MAKLEFTAGTQRLVISGNNDEIKWSSIFVERDDKLVPLGSESLSIIKDKLLPALRGVSTSETRVYKGIRIVPLMNLSEPHSALSAEPMDGGGVTLHLLDINNKFYPVMRLNGQEVMKLIAWLEELKA